MSGLHNMLNETVANALMRIVNNYRSDRGNMDCWLTQREIETIELAAEELDAAKVGEARYEYVRCLNPRGFKSLFMHCLGHDVKFDDAVDTARASGAAHGERK